MFSATYPENIQNLCRDVLRPGYEIVDTVGESSIQTAEKVNCSSRLKTIVHILLVSLTFERQENIEDENCIVW